MEKLIQMIGLLLFLLIKNTSGAYTLKQTIPNNGNLNLKVVISQSGNRMIAGNQNGSLLVYRFSAGEYIFSQEFNLV